MSANPDGMRLFFGFDLFCAVTTSFIVEAAEVMIDGNQEGTGEVRLL